MYVYYIVLHVLKPHYVQGLVVHAYTLAVHWYIANLFRNASTNPGRQVSFSFVKSSLNSKSAVCKKKKKNHIMYFHGKAKFSVQHNSIQIMVNYFYMCIRWIRQLYSGQANVTLSSGHHPIAKRFLDLQFAQRFLF